MEEGFESTVDVGDGGLGVNQVLLHFPSELGGFITVLWLVFLLSQSIERLRLV